jgi:hypothetical protein
MSSGILALVPRYAREGDVVFHFLGCVVPFVLRRVDGQKYVLVGESYASSLMGGSIHGWSSEEYRTIMMV